MSAQRAMHWALQHHAAPCRSTCQLTDLLHTCLLLMEPHFFAVSLLALCKSPRNLDKLGKYISNPKSCPTEFVFSHVGTLEIAFARCGSAYRWESWVAHRSYSSNFFPALLLQRHWEPSLGLQLWPSQLHTCIWYDGIILTYSIINKHYKNIEIDALLGKTKSGSSFCRYWFQQPQAYPFNLAHQLAHGAHWLRSELHYFTCHFLARSPPWA